MGQSFYLTCTWGWNEIIVRSTTGVLWIWGQTDHMVWGQEGLNKILHIDALPGAIVIILGMERRCEGINEDLLPKQLYSYLFDRWTTKSAKSMGRISWNACAWEWARWDNFEDRNSFRNKMSDGIAKELTLKWTPSIDDFSNDATMIHQGSHMIKYQGVGDCGDGWRQMNRHQCYRQVYSGI